MKPSEVRLEDLFKAGVQYKIPLFQRHYVWDKADQWQPLWEDIETKCDQRLSQNQGQPSRHFTGAIVIEHKATPAGAVPKYEIIDGQQRLATFQIIFCALRDICESNRYDDIAKVVNVYLRNEDVLLPGSDDEQYKLIPTEFDKDQFISLVDNRVDDSSGRMRSAYDFFKDKISRYVNNDRDKIVKLFHSMRNDFGFVQILLELRDEPEKIFESLNARGKRLLQFDLLRNDLFLRARGNRDRFYRDYWDHFETSYWDPETKKLGTSSELFLQHFLMAKLGTERVKPEFTVYQRQYHRNLGRSCDIEYEFFELKRYSEVYEKMTDCEDTSEIRQRMQFYDTFGLTTLRPFVLFVKCEIGLSGQELERVFDILESYTIRRMLCYGGKRGLKNYNIFFSEIIKNLRDDFSLEHFVSHLSNQTSGARRYPANNEVSSALHTPYDDSMMFFPSNQDVTDALRGLWIETAGAIKKRLIRYILYRIEMKKREDRFVESLGVPLVFKDDLTLEHIMPNEWKKTWHLPVADGAIISETDSDGNYSVYVNRDVGGAKCLYEDLFLDPEKPTKDQLVNDSYLDAFKLALARDHVLQSIGNLTLVTRALNGLMGNRTFPKKKEALRASILKLNNEICEHDTWDVNEIYERAEELIEDVCKIWPSLDWFAENPL